MKLSMLPTLADGSRFLVFFGWNPVAGDAVSFARFAAGEVREQSRLARGMVSL
jgi:phage repressor protein C with HTH and peptisase S24 domain